MEKSKLHPRFIKKTLLITVAVILFSLIGSFAQLLFLDKPNNILAEVASPAPPTDCPPASYGEWIESTVDSDQASSLQDCEWISADHHQDFTERDMFIQDGHLCLIIFCSLYAGFITYKKRKAIQ